MAGQEVAPPAPPGVPAPPHPVKNGTLVRLIVSPLVLGVVVAVCWIHASGGPVLGTDLLLVLFAAVGGYGMARLVARPDSRPVELWLPTLACAALGAVGLFAPEGGVTRGAWRAGLTAGGLVALLFVHWRDVRPDALDRIARAFV